MSRYCKNCFKKLPRGHARKKILNGGLFFGGVSAIDSEASILSDDINIDALCYSCQMILWIERNERKRISRSKISRKRKKTIRKTS